MKGVCLIFAVFGLAVGLAVMVIVGLIYRSIAKMDPGTERMAEIARYIRSGARAYLYRQSKMIGIFIVIISVLLALSRGLYMAASFVVGSLLSLLSAYIGMNAATMANVRTANVARRSPGRAAIVAFRGGAVMGLSIVGLSLIGISTLYILYGFFIEDLRVLLENVVGFGFGASLAALFAQLGGGIYTKAADIGADLVGKVEKGIPEDDPRNPAVIADQVGDNVGDCAGRGADLFESFSDNIIASMILGLSLAASLQILNVHKVIGFPIAVEALGAIATVIGLLMVRESKDPMSSINMGLATSVIVCAVGFLLLTVKTGMIGGYRLFLAYLSGLVASLAIGYATQYYTSANYSPVRSIAEASESGPAINLIFGLSIGMESSIVPVIIISVVILFSFLIMGGTANIAEGIYGITAATLGILSTTGFIMSSDTFGPISDNAGGIAEMSGIEEEVREATDVLDSVGNTTKALTKGYAMSCASLSALVLFASYVYLLREYGHSGMIDLSHPYTIVGIFIGASIPFIFSSMAIKAVGKTAFQMVEEVRRQFREIKGLIEGKAKPDYERCVDISTMNALKEMIKPTLISIISPVLVGLILGGEALGGFLISATISGALLAVFMFNAGGAWDNAKKYIEAGNLGGKGTPTHAASVIGDTVGDPLKDTAGPSLHILIKLLNIIALTIIPIIVALSLL